MTQNYRAVVVGVSAGGFDALSTVIPEMPKDFPLPMAVVQHRRPDSDDFLATHLDAKSRIRVKEADDKEPILPGSVYLAPSGYHLLVEADEIFALSLDDRVNHCRPSIDVLFESAADVYQEGLIGVILTGNNADGSCGMKHIKDRGGLTVAQDPAYAEFERMPAETIKTVQVDKILHIDDIAPFLIRCCGSSGGIHEIIAMKQVN